MSKHLFFSILSLHEKELDRLFSIKITLQWHILQFNLPQPRLCSFSLHLTLTALFTNPSESHFVLYLCSISAANLRTAMSNVGNHSAASSRPKMVTSAAFESVFSQLDRSNNQRVELLRLCLTYNGNFFAVLWRSQHLALLY